ncbi:hypothetical protein [Palleronia abyssalis]|uniref:Uncharacterized protein n=1 Tax=Palleronia abyssalis TaxID=1501240 RepID=A0A2R8BYS3_9RHOB|nr:hypothetical protein [Palleronia abyssalis]SPJ25263.1 hypothetical protein PAA8504_03114 [Palleronia abyssalis]
MMKQSRTYIVAACVAASTLAGGAAISQVAHEKAFPTENTHATPQMQAEFPDLF